MNSNKRSKIAIFYFEAPYWIGHFEFSNFDIVFEFSDFEGEYSCSRKYHRKKYYRFER